MPTRFLLAGLKFFGIAGAAAIGVALGAPIDAVRFLGVMALACAGTGFILHLVSLQRIDPHAFELLRLRSSAALRSVWAACSHAASIVTGSAHSASSRAAP